MVGVVHQLQFAQGEMRDRMGVLGQLRMQVPADGVACLALVRFIAGSPRGNPGCGARPTRRWRRGSGVVDVAVEGVAGVCVDEDRCASAASRDAARCRRAECCRRARRNGTSSARAPARRGRARCARRSSSPPAGPAAYWRGRRRCRPSRSRPRPCAGLRPAAASAAAATMSTARSKPSSVAQVAAALGAGLVVAQFDAGARPGRTALGASGDEARGGEAVGDAADMRH